MKLIGGGFPLPPPRYKFPKSKRSPQATLANPSVPLSPTLICVLVSETVFFIFFPPPLQAAITTETRPILR